MNFLTSGGIFGNLIRGLGQRFGLGKTYNQPTYDMSGLSGLPFGGTAAFQNLDIRDIFDRRKTEEEDNEEEINAINLNDFEGLPTTSFIDRINLNDYPQTQFGDNPNKDIISPVFNRNRNFDIGELVADAKTDNRTLLEKLLNPDLNVDEAIDKEEEKRKREQELLQLIQNA